MENYLNELLKDSAAATTVKKRVSFLLSCYEAVKAVKRVPNNDLSFLNSEKIVLDRVNDSPTNNASTKYGRLVHIIMAIKSEEPSSLTKRAKGRYEKLVEQVKPQKDQLNDNNIMNDKQKEKFMTIPQLNKVVEDALIKLFDKYQIMNRGVKQSDIKRLKAIEKTRDLNLFTFARDLQDVVVMACYVWQPALRNNYGDLHIGNTRTAKANDRNWLVVNKRVKSMYLIMNKYKNVYAMGQQKLDLSPKLTALLFQWLDVLHACLNENPKFPLLYKFAAHGKCEYMPNTGSIQKQIPRVFQKHTGKPIGINDLRHSWEKYIQDSGEYGRMTVNQKKEMHRMLLHSFEVAQRYNLLHPEPDIDVNE